MKNLVYILVHDEEIRKLKREYYAKHGVYPPPYDLDRNPGIEIYKKELKALLKEAPE